MTVTRDTIATPPHPDAAAAWLRDLLEQLGPQADALLTEVLASRDVRGLRVVGPLTTDGKRCALVGLVGDLRRTEAGWRWGMWLPAIHDAVSDDATTWGTAPTRLAADRALCLALREIGWDPVEVPTEEAVAEEAAREAQAQENAQNAMSAGTGVPRELLFGAQPQWTRTSPTAADPDRLGQVRERPNARPHDHGAAALRHARRTLDSARRQEEAEHPTPHDGLQEFVERFNQRLSYGARATRVREGVEVVWRGEAGEVTCTMSPRMLVEVGQEALAARFALWVEFVRGERTEEALGEEPDWIESCEVELMRRPEPRGRP